MLWTRSSTPLLAQQLCKHGCFRPVPRLSRTGTIPLQRYVRQQQGLAHQEDLFVCLHSKSLHSKGSLLVHVARLGRVGKYTPPPSGFTGVLDLDGCNWVYLDWAYLDLDEDLATQQLETYTGASRVCGLFFQPYA